MLLKNISDRVVHVCGLAVEPGRTVTVDEAAYRAWLTRAPRNRRTAKRTSRSTADIDAEGTIVPRDERVPSERAHKGRSAETGMAPAAIELARHECGA